MKKNPKNATIRIRVNQEQMIYLKAKALEKGITVTAYVKAYYIPF